MITRLLNNLRRFRGKEDGMATIEFVFWFPVFMMTTYSGVEMGIVAWNHTNLERALDETIQDVRMNRIEEYDSSIGAVWTHTLLKQIICDKAGVIPDCFDNLALEMLSINPYAEDSIFSDNPESDLGSVFSNPYCVDTPEEVRGKEDQLFTPGTSNQLMVVRACIEVDPLFFGTTLGRLAQQDPDGQYELHSTTVFVHEPF